MNASNDRLVRSEDLNHHGTLFAGRLTGWFVETCFVAAARLVGKTETLVCLKIHGLRFDAPSENGDLLRIEARVLYAGNTSIRVHARAYRNRDPKPVVDGYVTFVSVDEDGKKIPHGAVLPPTSDPAEQVARQQAAGIR